jgi:hypothetical protein
MDRETKKYFYSYIHGHYSYRFGVINAYNKADVRRQLKLSEKVNRFRHLVIKLVGYQPSQLY